MFQSKPALWPKHTVAFIPELKNRVELQEQIKAILIQVLIAQIQQASQMFAEEENSAEDDDAQGDDSGEAR